VLKRNYNSLVEDVNSRFKMVHEKIFRWWTGSSFQNKKVF
jgi:hypothetical protein